MSYFNGSGGKNDWANGVEESLGDVIEEKLEEKAKEDAEETAKEGGKAALKGIDKLTDKIKPVKAVKDKVKDFWHNNPVARLKHSIQKKIKKLKDSAKKLAKDGVKAVVKAAAKAMKGLWSWIVAHPIPSLIIFIILIIIFSSTDIDLSDSFGSDTDNDDTNEILDDPSFNFNGLSDAEIMIILMDDCVSQEYVSLGDLDTDKEESAKWIYSVFRSYGFNNASIAGILGNLDRESGLDPSMIEGILDEYGYLGTRKAAALLSMNNYTTNTLFPSYDRAGTEYSRDGYKVVDSAGNVTYYCGIGLAQWTAGNALNLLSAAETLGMDWYSMDFQLAYMLSDSLYRPGMFSTWVSNQEEGGEDEESWIEAARASGIYFAHQYEGNTKHDDKRADAAEAWYNIIADWDDSQVDETYVDSIVMLAGDLGAVIEFKDVADMSYRCRNANVFDNSSLVAAAVSFAWPQKELSYNNGTNLYRAVIDAIDSTSYYKACDRTVAGAVKWSGTDDDYPFTTSNQLNYLASSPKWEFVGMANSLSIDDLQPGDVFIVVGSGSGHTFIYVGEEAVEKAYAGEIVAGSNTVSASLDTRSASCNTDTTYTLNNGGSDSHGIYQVYRCVEPDHSSTYTNIGSGISN